MSHERKALLKSAASNVVTILGYISTGSTFLPVMVFLRPYLRPFGVVLIIVGIFRGALGVIKQNSNQLEAVRSAKEADIETLRAEKNAEIAARNERIVFLTAVHPVIDIEILMVVPRGKIGEKGIDLYVWATLILREPREVEIYKFELESVRQGIVMSTLAVYDVNQWGRVIRDDLNGYRGFAMQPLPSYKLTQRGASVQGWLHFRFDDLIESQICKSVLRFTVHTANGSCAREIDGGLAFPDPKNKGSIQAIDSPFLRGLGLGS